MSTVTHDLAHDGTAMLGRQLQRLRNNPGLLILTQTMPVTMLLFFGYVFGSALAMPGEEYRAFLVPGLLVATAANGLMTGMFQAAQDTHRGVTDRLRTLPVSRAAVPLGQAVADLLVTAAGLVPFLLVGLAVGWRMEGSAPGAAGAVGLLLLFRFATTWIGVFLGAAHPQRGGRRSTGRRDLHPAAAVQRVHPYRRAAGLAAHGRRVESDQRGDHGAAGPVRQRAGAGGGRLAGGASGRRVAGLVRGPAGGVRPARRTPVRARGGLSGRAEVTAGRGEGGTGTADACGRRRRAHGRGRTRTRPGRTAYGTGRRTERAYGGAGVRVTPALGTTPGRRCVPWG